MPRRNPPAKWVLPETVDPGERICYTIQVPNERFHVAAFLGALYNLTSARFWQDDPGHTALEVAKVWQDIYDELEHCVAENWTVRLNPDDCTEVQQFDGTTMDFVDVFSLRCAVDTVIGEVFPPTNSPQPGQPGEQPGGTSPEPGECWTLKYPVTPNGATLIPLQITDGWTITPLALDGASTDGRFGPANTWVCANGNRFALGGCAGTSYTDSNDPAPSDPHMGVLLAAPDGTFTFLQVGTTITIPSGSTPGNYQLIVNNNDVSIPPPIFPFLPQGDLTVQLEICTPGASHLYNFLSSDGGWLPDEELLTQNPDPIWVSTVGWQQTECDVNVLPSCNEYNFIYKHYSSTFHLVKMKVTYSNSAMSNPGALQSAGAGAFADNTRQDTTSPAAGTHTLIYEPTGGIDTDRLFFISSYGIVGGPSIDLRTVSIQVFITGTPPTW